MDLKQLTGKRVCIAVSGGADSTVLLHYLKSIEKTYSFSLSAVHCEHGIRGEESKADMRFVQSLCAQYGVPCYTFEEDCIEKSKREKVSLETAARVFRRSCFSSLVEKGMVDYIATAHHLQDEAETVLFRLARGSGLSGASAIKETDGYYLRPILTWSKADILAYAQTHAIAYREDSTNAQLCATRNVIRWKVLPILEQAVPGASENLARFAFLAAQDEEYLRRLSEELLVEKDGTIGVRFSEEQPLFSRACLFAMRKSGLEKDYTQAHVNALFALQFSQRGSLLDLPGGVCAERDFDCIRFYSKKEKRVLQKPKERVEQFSENGFDGGRYAVNVKTTPQDAEENEWKVLRVDAEKIPKDAVFRFRREGDEMEKFGGGTQTLKKFFNDKKIPVQERAHLPLIAQEQGNKVYAVCGVEIAQLLKITQETKKIYYILLQKNQGDHE